jgi:predicted O-methyltransferase YrrM
MNIAQHNSVVLDFMRRAQHKRIVPHHISPASGLFLATLVRSMRAKCILEIGTLWGYSTWWLYQGLADVIASNIVTIEKELKHRQLAEQFFGATALAHVTLVTGDAIQLLPQYPAAEFDVIFLDADRRDYAVLLPQLVRVLRPGGLFIIDNVSQIQQPGKLAVRQPFLQVLEHHSNLSGVMVRAETELWLGFKL